MQCPRVLSAVLVTLVLLATVPRFEQRVVAQTAPDAAAGATFANQEPMVDPGLAEVSQAFVRLPLAAILGAALALRPKRRGTPTRKPVVIQTQIILAVIGAIIMLVVGASLARAFGIVGAANLIRYRSTIEDPKDAGVMLGCLAVGLASGVGLYALAAFSTVFLVMALAIIESFEPKTSQKFELKVTVGNDAAEFRPRLESVLSRYDIDNSLRAASNEELSYDVKVPFEVETDRVTNAILKIGDDDKLAVQWDEKGKKKK